MTIDPAVPALALPMDVKPLVVRTKDNVNDRVEAVRDQIYEFFRQACAEEGVDAVILKSYPFEHPAWVKFECWLRRAAESHLTDRSEATLTILPRVFHRYDHEINLEIKEGHRTKHYRSIVELDAANVRALVRYMLRRTEFDIFGFKRVRSQPWELWWPRNVVTRLGKDWLSIAVPYLYLAGFFFFLLVPPFGVLMLLAAVGLHIYARRRRAYFLSPGKPALEPRRLLRMDSWQALVRDIGGASQSVKEALKRELAVGFSEGVQLSDERIWYWGVDGTVEREQLVVSFRRAAAFVHIYAYGKDLYVGWDAHVNAGTWVERRVADGLEPQTGQYCCVNNIESGWHVPNEYDITDANCLIEWVHAAMTKVTKQVLAEHKIDQWIDFRILRGERQGVVGRQDPEPSKSKQLISGFKFRREA